MKVREKMISYSNAIKRELTLYKNLLADKRTPLPAKILLWCTVGYLVMPFDIIPDFIPVLGLLDDIIIAGSLIYIAFLIVPQELIRIHRMELPGSFKTVEDNSI
jgi:uncharacterized membrane protein YkvA (DUF1232 family)